MKYAIISDLHSNLEALEIVINRIDSLGVDEIICLGDIVGYNANPNECVDIIKNRKIKCVMGNHDARASEIEEPYNFNTLAREAIYWTRDHLADEASIFLKCLPRKMSFDSDKSLAVHGFINDTDRYILSFGDAYENFRLMHDEPIQPMVCFFGHTHMPVVYRYADYKVSVLAKKTMELIAGSRYLINPGSVGQPRDGNPLSSFLVYDARKMKIEFFRQEYDIGKCCKKIIDAGLPQRLADRLMAGC